MRTGASFGKFITTAPGMLLVLVGVGACAAVSFAQGNVSAQLPNGPAKPGFEIRRFVPNGGIFKTFSVEQTEPLQKVLQDGRVAEDTPVLVTATAAGNLALLTDEIHLDNGAVVRAGVLFDPGGKRATAERPDQVFTRWYGFALTFPGCEIFGE